MRQRFAFSVIAVLLLLVLGGCASSGVLPERPREIRLEDPLPLDPSVRSGRLDNGLTYLIRAYGKPAERADVRLVVDAGSLVEEEDQRGLAHFVEHMAFNGSEHFGEQELVDYLESIGMRFGPDINAYTSFDETVYTLTVPTDDPLLLDRAFLILEDWAHGVAFDEAAVERERGVVIEEWRLGRGAGARLRDAQLPVMLRGSRYAERLPIGELEVLETATAADLRRFYETWYRPDRMAVVAVGDFDPDEVEEAIRSRFSNLRPADEAAPPSTFDIPAHDETLFTLNSDPEVSNTFVSVQYKLPAAEQGTFGTYRRRLVETLYLSILNERLSVTARQPEPPFLFASASQGALVRAGEVFTLAAAVEPGRSAAGLAAVLTEAERAFRHGVTEGEVERAKRNMLLFYDQALVEIEKLDSSLFAAEYTRHFLTDEPIPGIAREVAMVHVFLPGISPREVHTVGSRWMEEGSRVVSVTAPESATVPLPAQETLATVLAGVAATEIEPYDDRTLDRPLLDAAPEPGEIVAESAVPEVSLTRWILSNGIEVLLRPTDFQNDQILLAGFSPGGLSLVSDRDHPSGFLATTLVGEGGLGAFDQVQLAKALSGVAAGAQPYLTELEEGITASASINSLKEMFELVYLTFTAPRIDPQAADAFLARSRALVKDRLANPGTVFSDRMVRALTQDHPRRRPVSVALLEEVDLETAVEVYRDRFGDAGDFTFVLVGSFDIDDLREPVRTYLASLPATGREETWRDVAPRAPAGNVEVEVTKGLEPRSTVQVVFSRDVEWSREGEYAMGTLESILGARLREVLREDLGATYGVQVSSSLTSRPFEHATLRIAFGCAPEKVEELRSVVFSELERLRSEPVEEDELDKVLEAQRRSRELRLKQNAFWVGALKTYEVRGIDPRDLLKFEELIGAMTPERVRRAAEEYIDPERYVFGVLYPEGESVETEATAAEESAAAGG
ncbi:MAG: insulinase family protein [Acidobacteriota bacterium]